MSSDPPSSGKLDNGWAKTKTDASGPSEPEAGDGAPAANTKIALLRESLRDSLRDTLPPPVPVALYVQTMMSQAEDDEPEPASPSWRGEPPLALADSWRSPSLPSPRPPSELPGRDDPEELALHVPELSITAEVNIGDLVDLVTLEEIDALAMAHQEITVVTPILQDLGPLSDNPFGGAVVKAPRTDAPPRTLRAPQSGDAQGGGLPRAASKPKFSFGAAMEPEPLVSEGGGTVLDPSHPLDLFEGIGAFDEHPFSERSLQSSRSEAPSTKPWSSGRPPSAAPISPAVDSRGSIPPILAAWSVGPSKASPSEGPPSTMKGPFGGPSPLPGRAAPPSAAPRPAVAVPPARAVPAVATPVVTPRTAPTAPIRRNPVPAQPVEPAEPSRDYLGEIQERLDASDDYGAMMLAENLLVIEPDNTEAMQCIDICRGRIIDQIVGRLGGRRLIPRVLMSMEELRWLSLDHRAGFLLSNIDGTMTIEEVLDVSGMAELDALRILNDFCDKGVIEVPKPRPRR